MLLPLCTYLLPIRRAKFSAVEAAELADYFHRLGEARCDVLVIDGSPPAVFAQYQNVWAAVCRHERVDRRFGYDNDKVNGIHTGVERSGYEKIILADDDIRYDANAIAQTLQQLDQFEVVRPQNFLKPLPWWARMEAARMLINRATLATADYPGTCAFRRATMLSAGHYDGDVLFDNEEIIRHFARREAAIHYAIDLFVRKRPPRFRKWLEQRPRQAYEDFGMRAKTTFFFALPPLAIVSAVVFGRVGAAIALAILLVMPAVIAYRGRQRGRAEKFFPLSVIFFAPLWIVERSLSTYWASYWFLTRGGYPFGGRLLTKGVGRDWRSGGRIAAATARRQLGS